MDKALRDELTKYVRTCPTVEIRTLADELESAKESLQSEITLLQTLLTTATSRKSSTLPAPSPTLSKGDLELYHTSTQPNTYTTINYPTLSSTLGRLPADFDEVNQFTSIRSIKITNTVLPLTPLSQNFLLNMHKKILTHDYSSVFKKPVTPQSAPGYFEVISFPMDLSLIRKMIVNDIIVSLRLFRDYIGLMCHNCVKFNGIQSEYGGFTVEFEAFVDTVFEEVCVAGNASHWKDNERVISSVEGGEGSVTVVSGGFLGLGKGEGGCVFEESYYVEKKSEEMEKKRSESEVIQFDVDSGNDNGNDDDDEVKESIAIAAVGRDENENKDKKGGETEAVQEEEPSESTKPKQKEKERSPSPAAKPPQAKATPLESTKNLTPPPQKEEKEKKVTKSKTPPPPSPSSSASLSPSPSPSLSPASSPVPSPSTKHKRKRSPSPSQSPPAPPQQSSRSSRSRNDAAPTPAPAPAAPAPSTGDRKSHKKGATAAQPKEKVKGVSHKRGASQLARNLAAAEAAAKEEKEKGGKEKGKGEKVAKQEEKEKVEAKGRKSRSRK